MEKPILFNTEMVQAILRGHKTQTRRLVKNKYSNTDIEKRGYQLIEIQNDTPPDVYNPETKTTTRHLKMCALIKPPCQVGDILWVRETWLKADDGYYYKADIKVPSESEDLRKAYGYKWRPSIHMPKAAARLFLKVTNVRVERLRDITPEDIRSEGLLSMGVHCLDYELAIAEWQLLWDSIYSKQAFGWDANPWVWVIEFKKI